MRVSQPRKLGDCYAPAPPFLPSSQLDRQKALKSARPGNSSGVRRVDRPTLLDSASPRTAAGIAVQTNTIMQFVCWVDSQQSRH